jgi:hypothetical protein
VRVSQAQVGCRSADIEGEEDGKESVARTIRENLALDGEFIWTKSGKLAHQIDFDVCNNNNISSYRFIDRLNTVIMPQLMYMFKYHNTIDTIIAYVTIR